MKRRNFLATSVVAGAAAVSNVKNSYGQTGKGERQFLELRKYQMLVGKKKKELNDFLKEVAVPAWNRAGIKPVGVLNPSFGPNKPTLYVLLPHKNIESVIGLRQKLEYDKEYQKNGAGFLNATMDEQKYFRVESSLMRAFKNFPAVQVSDLAKQKKSRIFELRTYESHSELYAKRKIHMFNEGGELEIFRKTGFRRVFYGETLIGERIPNLTYMLVFENMAEREKAWNAFRTHPDWLKLKVKPIYKGTVSNITKYILTAASYSQV